MAITLKRARRTLIATAVLWAMGVGVAMAEPPTGNKLVGPVVNATSNATTVNILQVGNGNVISGIGNDAGNSAGAKATINSTGTHAITLTIQQVGAATGNTLTLAAYTDGLSPSSNKIKIFQGASKDTNDPGESDVDTPPVAPGTPNAVTGNTATITLGKASGGSQGSTVIVSQQNNNNTATIAFGTNTEATKGSLTLVQTGAAGNGSNIATISIDGTTNLNYQIAQKGVSNTLTLDADGLTAGGVKINFGAVDFDDKATWLAGVGTPSNHNNAADFQHFGGSTKLGINLGTTAGFDLSVTGSYNDIQVDLSNANTSSSISGLTFDGDGTSLVHRTLAIFGGTSGGSSATVSISAVDVNNSDLIVNAGAGAGKIILSSLTLNGNSTFSSTGGTVNLSSLTSSGTLTVDAGASGNITLSGLTLTGNSTFSTDPTIGSSFSMSVDKNQIKTVDVGLNKFTLTTGLNTTGTSVTVEQKGLGGKTFAMTNNTANATINVSQTGDSAQSATGIEFNAASGSTFSLTQR